MTNFANSIVDLEMNDEPLVIDVDELVRQRLPRYYRFIPRWLTRWLERIIHQRELNEILQRMCGKDGVGAAHEALDYLDIATEVEHADRIPAEGRFIFVSNHPLGGLDGEAAATCVSACEQIRQAIAWACRRNRG